MNIVAPYTNKKVNMKKIIKRIGFFMLFIAVTSACSMVNSSQSELPSDESNQTPTQTKRFALITPTITPTPFENNFNPTQTPTDTPQTQIAIEDLAPGLYIASMSIEKDHILLSDIYGQEAGILLNHSLHSIIDPTYRYLAYETSITSSPSSLFSSDFALYDLESNTVTPIDFLLDDYPLGFPGTWSPDGEYIIINLVADYIYPELALIKIADLSMLKLNLWDEQASDPQWSPNGTSIAFVGPIDIHDSQSNFGIYLLDTACITQIENCSEETNLLFGNENNDYENPSWSPDSDYLIFNCSPIKEVTNNLCIGDIETQTITKLENTEEYHDPTWSPDGEWISFSHQGDIYIYNLTSLETRLIAQNEEFLFWILIQTDS